MGVQKKLILRRQFILLIQFNYLIQLTVHFIYLFILFTFLGWPFLSRPIVVVVIVCCLSVHLLK